MFSLRIVTTDHYQATPIRDLDVLYSDFRGADTFKVPVIRIYGSTPAGQKTCMHVHGVFPYLYVPYDGSTPWDRYLRLFATSVDKAINVAQGHPTSNIQHVFKISLVSGLPMYGYHDKDQQFLKIYLYNPALIKKLADLLLGGAVMNKIFQPHESHIPYTLQMFIDYNLYGMNLINVAACKFRQNKEDDNGNPTDRGLSPDSFLDNSFHYIADKVWNTQTIQSSWYNDADVEKQSTCELEVDVVAADILNRQEVDSNKGGNPGLIALWEEERQRKFARGELSQITPQNSMEHMNVEITDSDRELQEKFRDIVLELQPYMDSPAGSSQGSSEDSQRNFAATPASQLQDHLSQSDVSFSQETVIVGEEDDEDIAPLINVDSIQRVVSFSESFILQSQSSSEPASQNPSQDKTYDDKMLAKVLASLADDSSPVSSQAVAASQIQSLEEQDSILQHQPLVPSQEVEEDDEVETLEMSQRVWGGENDSEEPTSGPSNADEGFDLEGMDATWNGTQIAAQLGSDIAEKEDSDNEEDDDIPQLDGTSDEKPEEEKKQTARKRLGVTGPVVSTSYNNMIKEMQANNEGKGQLSNQSNLHSNFQTPTPTYDQSSNRLDQSRINNAYDANSQGSVMYENNSQYYDYNTQNYNYNNSTYQDRFDNSFSQSGTENTGEWNQFSSTDQWNTENNLLNDVSLEEDNLFPLAASMSSELQKLTQDNGEETNIQRFSQDSATTPYSSVPSSQISGTSKSPSQETSTQATPNSSVSSPCSNSSMISPQLFPAEYTSSYNAFHSPNGSYSSSQGSYSNTFTQNSLPVDQNHPLGSQTYDNTSAYNSSGFQSPQNNQQHSFSTQNVHQNNFSSPSNYGNGQFSSPEMQFNSSYNTQGQYSNSPQDFQNGMYPNSSENANGHYFNSQSYHQNQLYGVSPVQNPPTNAPTSFAQGSLSFSPTNMGQNLSGEINSQGSSFIPRNPTTKKREYKKRTMSLPGVPSNERISKGNTQTQLCGNSSVLRSNSVSLTHGNGSPSFCGANKPASTLENLLLAGNDNTFQTKPDGLSSPSGRNPASYPNPVTTRGLGNLTNMVSSLTHTQRPENAFNSVYGGNPLSSPPKHQKVANYSDGSCPQHTLQPGQNMINLNHYNPPAMGNNFGSCGNNQYASHPFARSLSVDNSFPMKPKRGRPSKLMMALAARARANSIPADIVYKVPERNPAYTFSFMIPNPILKKQRFINSNDPLSMEKLKSVRMHPQDARKYSLMKIGREIVKIKRLSETELIQFCNKSCNEQDHEKANNSGIPQSEMATDIISIDTDESSQVFYAEVSCFAADSAENSFLSQSSSVLSSDTEQVALPEESPTKSMESQELQRDLTPSPPILTPEVSIPTVSREKPLINSDNSKEGPNRIGFDIPSLGKSSCVTHSAKALHGESTCIQNESRINSSLNSKEKAADLREKDVEIPCFQAKSNVECSHLPVESEQNIFAQKSGGNNSIISLKDNESDQSSIQPVCDKSVDEQQPTQLYNKSDTQKSTPANVHNKKSIPFSSEEIPIQGKGSDVSGKRNSQKGKPQCCCSKEICSCSTQKLVDPAAETGPVSVSDVESEPVLSKGREHKLMDDRIKEESRTCSSDLNKCSANVNNGQDTPKKSCSFWNHLSFKSPSAIGFQSPHKQHVNGKLFEKEKINQKPSSPGASPKNEKINKKPVSPGTSPKNGYLSKSPSSSSLFGGNNSTKEMFFNIYTKTMKGPVSQAAFEEHYANFMQKYLSQNKPASYGNLSPRNNAKGIHNSTPASSVVGKHDDNIQVHKGSALPVPVLEQDISSKATSSTESSRKYSRCLSTKKMQLKTNKFMEQVPVVGDSCAKDIDPMYKKRSWKGVRKSSKSTPGFQNDRSAEVWSSSLKSSCSISLKKVEEKLPVMKFGEERNIKCNKLFANVHMHDRQTSESPLSVSSSNASSRTTSRKDSSESYEEFPGDKNSVHKRIKRKSAEKCENENDGKRRKRCSKRNLSCKCEDFTTKKCNKVDSQTAEKKNQKDQKGKSQKKDVEIHYIITGRFKGFKKMMVELDNLDITEGQRISAAQFMNTSTFKSYLSRGKKNLYSSSKMTKIFSKSVTTSEDSCDKYDFKINKKKKISKNQQLGVAFQGRKHKKRKKPSSTKHSKLLNTLSVLHEATLANLNETTTTTCVTTTVTPKSNSVEDCHADYNDSLYKMALLSSSDSSKSDCSPPLANSPTGFFVDQNSQSRTTADVCSPSVSNSDGLSPSFQLSQTSPADCHNSSPSPVFSISQHNTHPFDPVISKSLDCAKKHFIEKQPSSSYIEGNKILDSEPFSATGQSKNFRSDASSLSAIQDTVSQHNLTHTNFGSTSSSNNGDRSPIIPSTGNLCVIRSDEFSDISDDEGVPNANNITSPNDSMGDYSIILSPEVGKTLSPDLALGSQGVKSKSILEQAVSNIGVEATKGTSSDHITVTSQLDQTANKLDTKEEADLNQSLPSNNSYMESSKQFPNEHSLEKERHKHIWTPDVLPPSKAQVQDTAVSHGLNTAVIQDAFCSNPEDLPEKPRELGGKVYKILSNRLSDLEEFESNGGYNSLKEWRSLQTRVKCFLPSQTDAQTLLENINKNPQLRFSLISDKTASFVPCKAPPSSKQVKAWLKGRELLQKRRQAVKEKASNAQNVKTIKEEKTISCVDKKQNPDDQQNITHEIVIKTENEPIPNIGISSTCLQEALHVTPKFKKTGSFPSKDTVKIEDGKDSFGKDSDDSGSSDRSEIISPSPPESRCVKLTNIKSSAFTDLKKKMSVKFASDSFSSKNSPDCHDNSYLTNKFHSSTPVMASPGALNVMRPGLKMSSALVHPKRLSALFGSPFTPIGQKSSQATDSCTEQVLTNSFVQSPNMPEGYTFPKETPADKPSTSETQNSLKTDSQLNQFATPVEDKKGHKSQIDAPTPQNSFGFKISLQNMQDVKGTHEVQNLTTLSIEVHAQTRGDLRPDPEVDPVHCLFYSILNDVHENKGKRRISGVIIVDRVSSDNANALKERTQMKQNTFGTPLDSSSAAGRSSPKPSTSQAYRSRSPSPRPSTPKRSKVKGVSPPPPRRFFPDQNIPGTMLHKSAVPQDDLEVTFVREELELFDSLVALVAKWDPDILVGYEIQNFSWGYLFQRAAQLSIPLCAKLSRIPNDKTGSHFAASKDEYGADHMSEIHIVGRIVLNLWRLLRHEVTLNNYTFENTTFHVLHRRIPLYSFRTLNSWFNHRTHLYRWKLIDYYMVRAKGNLQLIEHLDIIGQTSEFARVFGIEFYHVLSRGSQYRVESMMLRLAKPLNYIPVSPGVQQRAKMRAPECIPLTLEPESKFYADPVVVLDFQSLYPSIMIGHNYCFSTCLGRLKFLEEAHQGPIEFGCTNLQVPPATMKKLEKDITVSPNGVVFVKEHVRKGVISAMVEEILNTRLMVKKAMKKYKNDKGLHRMLDARQLGLKLIANVTYGYTAANFSGRMPCIEVGDSIVRKARETLERAIKLVEETPKWGARVVYGDTDSMFIELKGRSKEEAFEIGYEICDAVTATNPKPMKLKFEKVYMPCILQTKKRYVGFSYETPEQKEPTFDAKGIETVRRDACPAVAKILEKCVKLLFTSKDVSLVKSYVQNQCHKMMEGKVSIQDFIFAKEYRGMPGYKPGACVPALEISKKLIRQDRRAEPRVGERVPYVIVYGSPGLPLIQLVRQPMDLVLDPSLRLNVNYYITKQILPPLDRIFSLMGVNVFSWYNDMPKVVRMAPQFTGSNDAKKATISHFFSVTNCPVCDSQTNKPVCNKCMEDPQKDVVTLNQRVQNWDKTFADLSRICNNCMQVEDYSQPCVSLDCPILFRLSSAKVDIQKSVQLRQVVEQCFPF